MSRRLVLTSVAAVLALVAVLALARPSGSPNPVGSTGATEERGEDRGEERGGAKELQEQLERTEQRLEALQTAVAAGLFGTATPAVGTPAPGWAGERVMDATTDDWEPAVAADPNAPYMYLLTTRYGVGKACQGNCPTPWIALEVSRDGGGTWSAGTVVLSQSSLTYTAPGVSPEGEICTTPSSARISGRRGATWSSTPPRSGCSTRPARPTTTSATRASRPTSAASSPTPTTRRPSRRDRSRRPCAPPPTADSRGRRARPRRRPVARVVPPVDRRGRTWSSPVRIADEASGAAYKHADGFDEIYGDYGEIAITSTGKTFATCGESFSYVGPGGTWFNRQL